MGDEFTYAGDFDWLELTVTTLDDVIKVTSDEVIFGEFDRVGFGESGGECRGLLFGGGLSGSARDGDEMLRFRDVSPEVTVDVLLVAPDEPFECCYWVKKDIYRRFHLLISIICFKQGLFNVWK